MFFINYNKISERDIIFFVRQLSTLLAANIPFVQALKLVHEQINHSAFRKVILNIQMMIERGAQVKNAFQKYPEIFDEWFCHLIMMGEKTGQLAEMIEKIASWKENVFDIKRKIKKAFFYPCVVSVFALLMTAGIVIWIVPSFAELFKSLNAELPLPTRCLIQFSETLKSCGIYIFILIIFIVMFFIKQKNSFKKHFYNYGLKFPFVRNRLQKIIIARFLRSLSTLLSAGIPLAESLKIILKAVLHSEYHRSILKIQSAILRGKSFYQSIRLTQKFPPMVEQWIFIGEESGNLAEMLGRLADIFEKEIMASIEKVTVLLEPLLMIFLGILIGGLLITLYLPIFKLGAGV